MAEKRTQSTDSPAAIPSKLPNTAGAFLGEKTAGPLATATSKVKIMMNGKKRSEWAMIQLLIGALEETQAENADLRNTIAKQEAEIVRLKSAITGTNVDAEEKERRRSVVISGLIEISSKPSERRAADKTRLDQLMDELDVDVDIVSTYRMGEKKGDSPRLLKVIVGSTKQQQSTLRACGKLKNLSLFNGVFVRASLTQEQRREDYELRRQLRERRARGEQILPTMKADYFRRKLSKHQDNLHKSESLLADVRKFVNALKQRSDKSSSGSNLLDFATYETITQLTDSTAELAKKLAINDESSDLLEELLREKEIVEKRRPSKSAGKINSTFPLSNEVDENENICARPDRMLLDSDDENGEALDDEGHNTAGDDDDDNDDDDTKEVESESGEREEDDKEEEKASKKLTAAQKKLARMAPAGDGDATAVAAARDHRRINHMRRQLLKSSLVKDLRSQYSDAPLEIRAHQDILDGDDDFHAAEKSKRKFEEDYFIRLSDNKRQKHSQTRKMERSGMDQLLSFGSYLLPGADDGDGDEKVAVGKSGKKNAAAVRGQKRRRADGEDGPAKKFSKKHVPGRAKKKGGGRKRARFM